MFSKAFTKKTIIFYLFLILLSQLAFKAPSVKAYGALGGVAESSGSVAYNDNSSNHVSYARCAPNSHSYSSYRGGCVHPNYPNHSSTSSRNSLRQVLQILAAVIDIFINSLFGNSNNHYYGSNQSGSWSGNFAGSFGSGHGANYGSGFGQQYPQGSYPQGSNPPVIVQPNPSPYPQGSYPRQGSNPPNTNSGYGGPTFWENILSTTIGTTIGTFAGNGLGKLI
ncbi:MAG: hypothetical protein ACK481_01835 [Candidatus Melainabacteria bacterium]|jgi:hypothetical protein